MLLIGGIVMLQEGAMDQTFVIFFPPDVSINLCCDPWEVGFPWQNDLPLYLSLFLREVALPFCPCQLPLVIPSSLHPESWPPLLYSPSRFHEKLTSPSVSPEFVAAKFHWVEEGFYIYI